MKAATWLLAAGAVVAAAGLLVPAAGLVVLLDPEAAGERLQQLETGVWLFKTLLFGHGAWLVLASWRKLRPRGGPAGPSGSVAPLWQPVRETGDRRGPWTSSLVVAAMLVIAAILRWIGIREGLWHDEIFTLIDFIRPSLGQILTDYSSENQHLLYSVLAKACIRVFGESAATVRLPALVLGLASLWATLRLGRLTLGHRQGLLAAALLTVSYHHVWFSQNARGYTGLLFATALSTELFLRGLWLDRWSGWAGYAVAVAVGMALHPTMAFVVAAHGISLLWLVARSGAGVARFRRPLGALVLSVTLTMQSYALVLPQMVELYLQPGAGVDAAAPFRWKSPLWMLNETIRGLGIGLGFGWLGLIGAGLVFALGLSSLWARSRLTTACFLVPALLGGVTMALLGRNLWPRFFFNSGAFAALLAVEGAWVLGAAVARRFERSSVGLGAAAAGLLVLASAVTLPRVYGPKQDYAGALEFVEEQRRPGDQVVALDLAADAYSAYHAPGLAVAYSLEELELKRASAGRTWILYTLAEHLAATKPALWQAVQARYEVVRAFPGTLGGGAIVVRRSLENGAGTERSGAAGGSSTGDVADELTDAPDQVHER